MKERTLEERRRQTANARKAFVAKGLATREHYVALGKLSVVRRAEKKRMIQTAIDRLEDFAAIASPRDASGLARAEMLTVAAILRNAL